MIRWKNERKMHRILCAYPIRIENSTVSLKRWCRKSTSVSVDGSTNKWRVSAKFYARSKQQRSHRSFECIYAFCAMAQIVCMHFYLFHSSSSSSRTPNEQINRPLQNQLSCFRQTISSLANHQQ